MKTSENFHNQIGRIALRPPVHLSISVHGQAYISQSPSAENVLVPGMSEGAGRLGLAARIASVARWIAGYIDTMADYYAAATTYEQLSKLSDAELQRRGLSRQTLAREVFERQGLVPTD